VTTRSGTPDVLSCSAGRVSIAKAALSLDISDEHLSCMLALVTYFAGPEARDIFEPQRQKIHIFAVCTLLFIQIFGRHLFDFSSQDHWPAFQGANEAAVEQVEPKATLSRSRPSSSKAGRHPTACCIVRATEYLEIKCVHHES
jgi:hypothetical protein